VATREFSLPSFAKINPTLRILGKRSDGYHEVLTVLQTVSLHDDIHFRLHEPSGFSFSCSDPSVPTDESNLISRAAQILIERFQPTFGVAVNLEKRIPLQGGLGGASSNAAVTLLGLAKIWELHLTLDDLFAIGASLGADISFFFLGGRALATGIGAELQTLPDTRSLSLIIVTPTAKVSTFEAYTLLKVPALTSANSAPILSSSRYKGFLSESDQWTLDNDFEKVIFEKEPEIKRVRKALLDAGARGVLLAGSGSSVFGIFDNAQAQRCALEEIQAEAGWRVFPCDTLSRGDYLKALGSCGTPLLRSSNKRFDSGA
jgi:4-diphosphocytidyl-2-C-methyl-D-erythritol kinase